MPSPGDRRLKPAPLVLAVLIVVALAANVILVLTLPGSVPGHDALAISGLVPVVPFLATGAIAILLTSLRPANPVGWLLGALVVAFAASNASQAYLYHSLYSTDVPRALLAPVVLADAAVSLPAIFWQLLLVFPDGHLLSPRWRIVAWVNLAAAIASGTAAMLDPAAMSDGHRTVANPLGRVLDVNVVHTISSGLGLVALAIGAAVVVSMVLRYRRAGSELREQLKWFAVGAVIAAVGLVVASATSTTSAWATPPPIIASTIGFAGLPICIGIAVLKYRLYDIDLVISRGLLYGSLAAMITAIYVGIVVGIGSLIGSGGRPNLALSIVATGVVALAFQPAKERLNRLANRLVYGQRATPYEVLSQFSQRVVESYAGEAALGRMARVLAEGTGAVRTEVWLRSGVLLRLAASHPTTDLAAEPVAVIGQIMPALPGADRVVAVRHQGELLGALTMTKRRGEALSPIELKLLEDLAQQAGQVLKNAGLTADLQARVVDLRESRKRLVNAQDAERRRLERNLHDGAQQHLVALKVKLGMAEALAVRDPERTEAALLELEGDTDEALHNLRDLARGIYPPLLAERGLVAAIEAQARKAGIPVHVAAEGVGRYPQETEAALYFCTLEALQNIQKYAGATAVTVTLVDARGRLSWQVEDDGSGFDPAGQRGSGLQNMADRVDALDGALTLESAPGTGTRIRAEIPVAVPV